MKKIFRRFLIFCSGADSDILSTCTSRSQVTSMVQGVTVLMPAITAFCAAFYAVGLRVENLFLLFFISLIYALFIFIIDINLIRGIDKNRLTQSLPGIITRVAVSLVASVLISDTLALALFHESIQERLGQNLTKQLHDVDASSNPKAAVIEKETSDLLNMSMASEHRPDMNENETINALHKAIQDTHLELERELSGKGVSEKRGDGFVARSIRERLVQLEKQLKIVLAAQKARVAAESENAKERARAIQNAIAEKKEKISRLEKEREEQKANIVSLKSDDLISRHRALIEICHENRWIAARVILLMLLFVIIDLAPVLAKIIAPIDEYDFKYHTTLYAAKSNQAIEKTAVKLMEPVHAKLSEDRIRLNLERQMADQEIERFIQSLALLQKATQAGFSLNSKIMSIIGQYPALSHLNKDLSSLLKKKLDGLFVFLESFGGKKTV